MSVFRVNKDKNYTCMSNYHLKDKNLSLKAIGLLSKLLSLPDDWNYSKNGLVSICKEGRTVIESALNELKENGYLEITEERKNGKFQYVYNIYEKPHTENLHTVNPYTVNPEQLNTNKLNTKQHYTNNTSLHLFYLYINNEQREKLQLEFNIQTTDYIGIRMQLKRLDVYISSDIEQYIVNRIGEYEIKYWIVKELHMSQYDLDNITKEKFTEIFENCKKYKNIENQTDFINYAIKSFKNYFELGR